VGVVFETGRALQMGDVERAIALIDEQLEQGESGVGIMRASIIPTVRNLFMARTLIDRAKASPYNYRDFEAAVNRLSPSEKAWLPQKKSGDGVNVYPLFLCARGAMSFTLASLEKIFHITAKTDKMLVTTGLDEKLLLHRLVTEIAIAAAPRKASSPTA
jgi:DNA polymerase-3 subunit delta